jgi:hypothetical protein
MEDCEFEKILDDIKNTQQLKQQLKDSVWKPMIKTYICRRDRQPKRKLLINLEVNDINKAIKYKSIKKYC